LRPERGPWQTAATGRAAVRMRASPRAGAALAGSGTLARWPSTGSLARVPGARATGARASGGAWPAERAQPEQVPMVPVPVPPVPVLPTAVSALVSPVPLPLRRTGRARPEPHEAPGPAVARPRPGSAPVAAGGAGGGRRRRAVAAPSRPAAQSLSRRLQGRSEQASERAPAGFLYAASAEQRAARASPRRASASKAKPESEPLLALRVCSVCAGAVRRDASTAPRAAVGRAPGRDFGRLPAGLWSRVDEPVRPRRHGRARPAATRAPWPACGQPSAALAARGCERPLRRAAARARAWSQLRRWVQPQACARAEARPRRRARCADGVEAVP
jgi:hypothetical protein